MKQHITVDQIEQLTKKGKVNYVGLQKKYKWFDYQMTWLNDKVYFLNIGQMIEILNKVDIDVRLKNGKQQGIGYINGNRKEKELCDALWECVKEILEK